MRHKLLPFSRLGTKRAIVFCIVLPYIGCVGAYADSIPFAGTSGDLSASAVFTLNGNSLSILLTNTSAVDVMVPRYVLTTLLWNLSSDSSATFTPVSAVLGTGSSLVHLATPSDGVVGGEWGFGSNLGVTSPFTATHGVSSTGLGSVFGQRSFPGGNLEGQAALQGLNFGITSDGDDPATGNGGTEVPLIKNSVLFTFTVSELSLDDIWGVQFVYGTTLGEGNIPGVPPFTPPPPPPTPPNNPIPEPITLALVGLGVAAVAARSKRAARF